MNFTSTTATIFYPDDNLSYNLAKCACPFGGDCHNGILKSNPGFWGMLVGHEVHFYKCPMGYCCTSSRHSPCDSIKACRRNRGGILCGQCKPGFSLSLFSFNCISNTNCESWWLWVFIIICNFVFVIFISHKTNFSIMTFCFTNRMCSVMKCYTMAIKGSRNSTTAYFHIFMLFFQTAYQLKIPFQRKEMESDNMLLSKLYSIISGIFCLDFLKGS